MDFTELKSLLAGRDPAFWRLLASQSLQAVDFDDLFLLSSLRKKAQARGLAQPDASAEPLRLALLGGCSLYPLRELVEHLLVVGGIPVKLFVGDYDNFVSEIMEPDSPLYEFAPQVIFLLPPDQRGKYQGRLTDTREQQQAEAAAVVQQLLDLAKTAHERTKAEVVLGNFIPPFQHDPGPMRSRTMGSDWNFRKWVNLELGMSAPAYVHICDLEFLASRYGGVNSRDERAWFESKQPGSSGFLVQVSRELAHIIASLRRPPKKVLVLDLDNTLWGGVVADDGMQGIEIGDTSPRGEAFKAFQKYIASLKDRGVLLAVCSKNDHARAMEPFEQHPEMALRPGDFVSFKANWEPKSENIRAMAAELNLGLDSFVFVDDNPAEIDIVRRFAPEVTTILLGPDPSAYATTLKDSRLFEPQTLTAEDAQRTDQYRSDAQRQALLASVTDMDAYLQSLEMEGAITEFTALDVPRLSQLINKSNQFNLTTRRRTEAEVEVLLNDPAHACFSMRLKDRFGDHGLIAIVVCRLEGDTLEIDTWLMSCRVLKRQVEEEVVNEYMRLAALRGCAKVRGVFLPTAKNSMVRDLYARMGFTLVLDEPERRVFERTVADFQPFPTKIRLSRKAYESI